MYLMPYGYFFLVLTRRIQAERRPL